MHAYEQHLAVNPLSGTLVSGVAHTPNLGGEGSSKPTTTQGT